VNALTVDVTDRVCASAVLPFLLFVWISMKESVKFLIKDPTIDWFQLGPCRALQHQLCVKLPHPPLYL